ncbi:hypothetical protein GCM10027451_30110 [Geodermatophilus aquaeductus]|jgi:hypothetical protein|uniref:Uncharacterized protein n=1 Tax=Geodermatophilus aquaeductus TaxID=1564161 RepID=A0A521FVU7_9ACTN|nr:hypothetical protein [Geodermatophilus aquaeductus]SMO99841.1 hypothetical protein SAMN06273567_11943 [Geodermatophilus aquaeductus]
MTPDPPPLGVPAPPSDAPPPRGGVLGFLGTMPGVLTALAGVITALATLYAVHVTSGASAPPLTQPSQPTPEASTPVDAASVADQATSASWTGSTVDDEVTALATDCVNGSVDACLTLLDLLAWGCADGDPYACDALYLVSPVGSEYEAYGATCGGRFEPLNGRCSEL